MKAFHRCASVSLCLLMLLSPMCSCGNNVSTPPAASDGKDYNQYLNSPAITPAQTAHGIAVPAVRSTSLTPYLESPLHPLCARRTAITTTGKPAAPTSLPAHIVSMPGTIRCITSCGSMEHGGIDLYQMGLDGQDRKLLRNYFSDVTSYSYTTNSGGGFLTILWSRIL